MIAVTFDYGQTLAELDLGALSGRVGERGARVSVEGLEAASEAAWAEYNAAKRRGDEGATPWIRFMTTLLERGGIEVAEGDSMAEVVEFLWLEQPKRNLWRRPIPEMFELVFDLKSRDVPLGIVSNSEGRLAELVSELGLATAFAVVADSGKLGFEKPDRRIFEYAARALGTAPDQLVHVGDSWEADVEGALGVGARAVWFGQASPPGRALPERVVSCPDAAALRSALRNWGIPA